jgi:hypothetical protein
VVDDREAEFVWFLGSRTGTRKHLLGSGCPHRNESKGAFEVNRKSKIGKPGEVKLVPESRSKLPTDAYAAFNRRDIDSIFALMAPEVNWPNGMEGGRLIGYDQVRAYWTRQWGILNPRVDPVGIEEDETGCVVVDVHQVVHDLSGNLVVDQFIQHVYSFQGDLIERMDIREAFQADQGKDISSEHA